MMTHSVYWSTGALVMLSIEPMRTEAGKREVKLELALKKYF